MTMGVVCFEMVYQCNRVNLAPGSFAIYNFYTNIVPRKNFTCFTEPAFFPSQPFHTVFRDLHVTVAIFLSFAKLCDKLMTLS